MFRIVKNMDFNNFYGLKKTACFFSQISDGNHKENVDKSVLNPWENSVINT